MASNTPKLVTVFGGAGFVGRHLVRRLAASGNRVIVATRSPERAAFLKVSGDVGQVEPRFCDVTHEASVAQLIDGADAVVNLVGGLNETRRGLFDDLHVALPAMIGQAVKDGGIGQFVHVSALGADDGAPSEYGRSKALGEHAVMDACPEAVILRPGIMFGPDDDFFNRFAALARLFPALPLFGGGHTRFQPVYVCDVADAICQALNQNNRASGPIQLGGPNVYSFQKLMTATLNATGRERFLLPLPMMAADVAGFFGDMALKFGITPPITRDQAKSLRVDNVVDASAPGFDVFGINPTPLEIILPTYMDRFRVSGRVWS
ncbi:MAG: complex I NDUFA9 subunit family protein [Alphaproteobacteria bacterium]